MSGYLVYFVLSNHPREISVPLFRKLSPKIQNSITATESKALYEKLVGNSEGSIPYNFVAPDNKGVQTSLAQFLGKYVFIDFWASWCAPCRAAIPHLKELYAQYHAKGLEIITISIDNDSIAWQKAIAADKMNIWRNILTNKNISDNYPNVKRPIPSGILIGKNGRIIWNSDQRESLDTALMEYIQ